MPRRRPPPRRRSLCLGVPKPKFVEHSGPPRRSSGSPRRSSAPPRQCLSVLVPFFR